MTSLEKKAKDYIDNNVFCNNITDFELEISKKAYIAGVKEKEQELYNSAEVEDIVIKWNLYQWDSSLDNEKTLSFQEWLKLYK